MKTSWLSFPTKAVWFQNANWSIELLEEGKEIVICHNQTNTYYGYWDSKSEIMRYDNPYPIPKYIKQKAIKLAIKHKMLSIYHPTK